jgi:hypothetical protein
MVLRRQSSGGSCEAEDGIVSPYVMMPGINFVYKLMWNVSPETVIGGALLEVEPGSVPRGRSPLPTRQLSELYGRW